MDDFDIIGALGALGVDEATAKELKSAISGGDYMNLVNALNKPMITLSDPNVKTILGKYGITADARSDNSMDETFGVMTRISEGFNYSVEVNSQNRDRVLDWLDENQVEYQAVTPLTYNIECADRDAAYRTGRALSEIIRKPTVRDSVEIEEKMSKNPNKRVKDAKDKMAELTPRNPIVAAVKVRSGAGAHAKGDPRKADKFARGAKYKPRFDEEIEFAVGDEVMVGEEIGTIKIPHGPNGTIGVIMNGSLEMVSESEVSRLDEGVMGMSKLNPLFRLRELAGMSNTISDDDFAGIEFSEPVSDPAGPLSAGAVDMDSEVEGPALDTDIDAGIDDMGADMPGDTGDVTASLDPIDGGDDMTGGMPGDLPPVNPEPVAGTDALAPMQSDAMAQIEDSLNGVQTKLSEIRLGEYKALIQKLQDLTNQVQMMGRDYLGERRKK